MMEEEERDLSGATFLIETEEPVTPPRSPSNDAFVVNKSSSPSPLASPVVLPSSPIDSPPKSTATSSISSSEKPDVANVSVPNAGTPKVHARATAPVNNSNSSASYGGFSKWISWAVGEDEEEEAQAPSNTASGPSTTNTIPVTSSSNSTPTTGSDKQTEQAVSTQNNAGGWGSWIASSIASVVTDIVDSAHELDDILSMKLEEEEERRLRAARNNNAVVGTEDMTEKRRRKEAAITLSDIAKRLEVGEPTSEAANTTTTTNNAGNNTTEGNNSTNNNNNNNSSSNSNPNAEKGGGSDWWNSYLTSSRNLINSALVPLSGIDMETMKKNVGDNLSDLMMKMEDVDEEVMKSGDVTAARGGTLGSDQGEGDVDSNEDGVTSHKPSQEIDQSIKPKRLEGFAYYFEEELGNVRLMAMELLSTEMSSKVGEKRKNVVVGMGEALLAMDTHFSQLRELLDECDSENSEVGNNEELKTENMRLNDRAKLKLKELENIMSEATTRMESLRKKVEPIFSSPQTHPDITVEVENYLKEIHQTALSSLAKYSSLCVEVLMRIVESWVVMEDTQEKAQQSIHASTATDRLFSFKCCKYISIMSSRLSEDLSRISHKYAMECSPLNALLTSIITDMDDATKAKIEEISNTHMNNIYLDAGDAISKVHDAKYLTIPVLQWIYMTRDAAL